jgi:ribosome-binding factor A
VPDIRRADRVARLLHSELADLVRREVKDPRVENVTLTAVRVSDDLRDAQVLFTPLGGLNDDARAETIEKGLSAAAPFLVAQLKKRLRLRSIPKLVFRRDRGLENLVRIHEVLDGMKRGGDGDGAP